ncbi:MAG TPA: ankyrin repeat domain-containing protein [Terriglobia bacterium]|nr:ankyrin repeat domain-containing protein [Terriglobia bacterium]
MNKEQEFLESIKSGDLAKLEDLLRTDPSLIGVRTEQGVSSLMLAVYYNQERVVDFLVDRVTELNIHEATALGRLDRVESLSQDDPATLDPFSPDGFTPLALAAYFGHTKVVNWLLEHGADPNISARNATKVMPLHSAAAQKDSVAAVAISKDLLDHGAQVNARQQAGWTPLHQAAASGNAELLKLLLSHGADRSATSEDGRTPIQMAEANNHSYAVEILRQHEALEVRNDG